MRPEVDPEMMELMGFADQQPKEHLYVRFSVEPFQNEVASKEKGRPVFDDVEFVEIRIPGDPDVRRRPLTPGDKQRFAKQYLAFRANQDQEAASGTPLSVWPLLRASQVEEAKHFGIRTVEQLAEIPDANLKNIGAGWSDLKLKARDWLARATDGALLSKLRDELTERDRRIETMEGILKEQSKAIEDLRKKRKE